MKVFWTMVFAVASQTLGAQDYDLLIKNGHLIDAKNKLDQPMDVAVRDGKIAEVAPQISPEKAEKVIDATGEIRSRDEGPTRTLTNSAWRPGGTPAGKVRDQQPLGSSQVRLASRRLPLAAG